MKIAPCRDCPFRTDRAAFISPARGREILRSLDRGGMFLCHKTVDYSDDGEGRITGASEWCVGALVLMDRGRGDAYSNQMVRVCDRLGLLPNLDSLDGSAVPKSKKAWIAFLKDGAQ